MGTRKTPVHSTGGFTITDQTIPLTDLIYGILGLTFLNHQDEGFTQIPLDSVYSGLKTLAERHPECFPDVYFTGRGSRWHSRQVEDALFRLAGALSVMSPRCRYLVFNAGSLRRVEASLREWFDPEVREVVEQLADEFYEEVKSGEDVSA